MSNPTEPAARREPPGPSPAGASVRQAGVDDAVVVGRLLHDFNVEFESPTPSADAFARRFTDLLARDDVIALLAEDDGPLGFGLLTLRPSPYYDGPIAQLEELYVVPDRRDGGIGTVLLHAALDVATDHDAGEMQINVDGDDYDTRRFYERHGFINVEPGADEPMLFYVRDLTADD